MHLKYSQITNSCTKNVIICQEKAHLYALRVDIKPVQKHLLTYCTAKVMRVLCCIKMWEIGQSKEFVDQPIRKKMISFEFNLLGSRVICQINMLYGA